MKIALIDDKDYGLDQIRESLKKSGLSPQIESLVWYNSFESYQKKSPGVNLLCYWTIIWI